MIFSTLKLIYSGFKIVAGDDGMTKKCIYCKVLLDENMVLDVCKRCGYGVWGEKMYAAIIENMEGARDAGDLYQGNVTDQFSDDSPKEVERAPTSFETPSSPQEIVNSPEPSEISTPSSQSDMPTSSSLVNEAIANIESHSVKKEGRGSAHVFQSSGKEEVLEDEVVLEEVSKEIEESFGEEEVSESVAPEVETADGSYFIEKPKENVEEKKSFGGGYGF